jgi:PadR family transcriptional regulator AphA
MTDRPDDDGPPDLSASAWAVLGVIADEPVHGFVVSRVLAADGELGRVWTVPRPIVYRELKKLVNLRLVTAGKTERSDQGPARTTMTITPEGRDLLDRWLRQPVDHVREVRASLLLKLALLDRRGEDPQSLLRAQRERLLPQLGGLERRRLEAVGFARQLAEWRLASTRATLAFLDAVIAESPPTD